MPEAWVQSEPGAPWDSVKKVTNYPITPASRVVFLTAGGGGFGDPRQREPGAVAEDARQGYISSDAAADYGVVLDPQDTADLAATEKLRAGGRSP